MSDQPPALSLSAANAVEAVAPSSLKGWSYFQREMNVVLPAALSRVDVLLAEAAKMMGR